MAKKILTEIAINATRESIWDHLMDFNTYKKWNPFIIDIKGQPIKGERLTVTLKNGDNRIVFKPKVTEVVPFQTFAWKGSLFVRGLFDGHHYFCLEEISSSQVKLIHGEDFSGLLSLIIFNKIADQTSSNFMAMNLALKKLCESGMNG